jgi:hypothetical protein
MKISKVFYCFLNRTLVMVDSERRFLSKVAAFFSFLFVLNMSKILDVAT